VRITLDVGSGWTGGFRPGALATAGLVGERTFHGRRAPIGHGLWTLPVGADNGIYAACAAAAAVSGNMPFEARRPSVPFNTDVRSNALAKGARLLLDAREVEHNQTGHRIRNAKAGT
jgi:hypothetical protein